MGSDQVGEGGGVNAPIIMRHSPCGGGGLEGGGPDTKRGRGLTRHRPRGGDLEGGR